MQSATSKLGLPGSARLCRPAGQFRFFDGLSRRFGRPSCRRHSQHRTHAFRKIYLDRWSASAMLLELREYPHAQTAISQQVPNELRSVPMLYSRQCGQQFGKSLTTILCLSVFFVAFTATPTIGINIIPIFDSVQSDSPSFDPSGVGLQNLFDYVELYYQDIFEDSHTLTINFWYDDLSDPNGTLGSHSLVSQSGGRETVANIRFDTRSGWCGTELVHRSRRRRRIRSSRWGRLCGVIYLRPRKTIITTMAGHRFLKLLKLATRAQPLVAERLGIRTCSASCCTRWAMHWACRAANTSTQTRDVGW